MIQRPYQNLCGNVNIGQNTKIGAFVDIGDRVSIGENCIIECFVAIPPGWEISDDVFIGQHVSFSNDKYPAVRVKEWEMEKGLVQCGASIGSGSTIGPGITIGAFAVIGQGSNVLSNVPEGETWAGNPAHKIT